ncbi:alpha/beta fold hydrolase [Microbaculum marinisediminis]|uniref:Alpha/beta hydrolase n=1 Tax=Microbaculum marinisediminis TaxID=2931392 RepID=A0AAW5R0Z9_9HYPH|nr:alpha/beta hydrolase [Microbaculum sp. A6E488]MCT8973000.1 alpha/beta hydrolase [Microbaculum sp. A6E488]
MADTAGAETLAETSEASAEWRDVSVTARDGLRLHLREYGARTSPHLPVVCLPGLTRNTRDFHELAVFLSTHKHRPRRVVAMDFRGRGGSGYDRNWKNYSPMVEMADVLDVLVARGIEAAAFVGTSRGGLVTMLLAAARPTVLKAVVLNDIGPAIEGRGLLRIKNVLAGTNVPATWDQAVDGLKRAYEAHFPALDDAAWDLFARRTYAEKDGRPMRDFDPKLMKTLANIDFNQPLPTMWPQFDGLAHIPVMVVRGDHSDILSAETAERMRDRHPDLDLLTVDGAGHAPLLFEPAVLNRISAFVTSAEDR